MEPIVVDQYGHYRGSYETLIESAGLRILLNESDNDYQGYSYLIVTNSAGDFGYLRFGWGSCSGCDWFEGCSSKEDYEELRSSLINDIRWEASREELKAYLDAKDWPIESWGGDGSVEFRNKYPIILS